jgi:hypothetical protein
MPSGTGGDHGDRPAGSGRRAERRRSRFALDLRAPDLQLCAAIAQQTPAEVGSAIDPPVRAADRGVVGRVRHMIVTTIDGTTVQETCTSVQHRC